MSDEEKFVKIEAKLPEHCEPGELVRGNFDKNKTNIVHWAIVAKDNKLVILPGDVVKFGDFKQQWLSYGKHFQLLPDYVRPPIMGAEFRSGALACARPQGDAETSWYLLGQEPNPFLVDRSSPNYLDSYFNIRDFGFAPNKPKVLCAAFQDWAIWAWLPTHPNNMTKLYAPT